MPDEFSDMSILDILKHIIREIEEIILRLMQDAK